MILLAFLLQVANANSSAPAKADKAESKPSAATKAKTAKAVAAQDAKTTKADKDAPKDAKKAERSASAKPEASTAARPPKPSGSAKQDKPVTGKVAKLAPDADASTTQSAKAGAKAQKAARTLVAGKSLVPAPRAATAAVARDPAPVAARPLPPAIAPIAQAMPRATRPVSPPPPPGVDTVRSIDSAAAIETFKSVCWDSFRDPQAFHAAVAATPLALSAAPRSTAASADPAQPSEVYRSDEAVLTYAASDSLPASIPSRQCSLKVRLPGTSDQLALAARIGIALGLPNGRTRTGASLAITSWDVAGADNRTVRLLAVSRNGRDGGTDLRLSALLLATPR